MIELYLSKRDRQGGVGIEINQILCKFMKEICKVGLQV